MATRMKMSLLLWSQLIAPRIQWIPVVSLTICLIASALQWLVLPVLQQETRAVESVLEDVASGRTRIDGATDQSERYQDFRNRLAENGDRGELLKVVFSEAHASGILLPQGDYSLISEVDGGYGKLQINLPVKGSYKQIRAFALGLLEKLPSLSLDEISFRRDNIKSSAVEARIRLTLYLKDPR